MAYREDEHPRAQDGRYTRKNDTGGDIDDLETETPDPLDPLRAGTRHMPDWDRTGDPDRDLAVAYNPAHDGDRPGLALVEHGGPGVARTLYDNRSLPNSPTVMGALAERHPGLYAGRPVGRQDSEATRTAIRTANEQTLRRFDTICERIGGDTEGARQARDVIRGQMQGHGFRNAPYNPDPRVRAAAALAGYPLARKAVQQLTRDPHPIVRAAAASRRDLTGPQMRRLARDEDDTVRREIHNNPMAQPSDRELRRAMKQQAA